MQRNANVGSKLLALIAVPAVVLVAVASVGARGRLDEADRSQLTENGARLAAASTSLVHELQLERLLTMRFVQGDETVAAELEEQRAATDGATESFVGPSAGMSGGPVGQRLDAAARQLTTIHDLRASIDDGNAAPDVVIEAYDNAVDGFLELEASIASSGGIPELTATLSDSLTLARAKEARAQRSARIATISVVGSFRSGDYPALDALEQEENRQFARLEESQNEVLTTSVRNAMATSEVRDADALMDRVMAQGVIGGSGQPGVEPARWQTSASGWLDTVHGAEGTTLDATINEAGVAAFEADKSARLYLIGTAAAVILSILLASLLARRINRRLQRLTTAANQLATVELPRLVDDLRSPGQSREAAEPIAPIEVDSKDEIGQLAEAFNAIQQVTSQVAEEQAALLRRGIADIFVHLARRNQSLLDRQIEFIDSLEAQEQDPDQLENLFKLDHLATRMRRNAESLLVLAGAEPPRRRARPVELADIVRVAIGEVEDFTRVNLRALDETTVGGHAAVDLAHLLSELMENATQFSPPDSTVEVLGARTADGGYAISIADHGIGMSAEQLAEANQLLSEPPPVGLALSRSLGFIVVGRLARRLQVTVRLSASADGGVIAVVQLPAAVLAGQIEERPAVGAPAPPETSGLAAPAHLSEALPAGEEFERGLAELIGSDAPPAATSAEDHEAFWGTKSDNAVEDGFIADLATDDLLLPPPPADLEDPVLPTRGPDVEEPPAPPPPPVDASFAPEARVEATPPTVAEPSWEPAPDWFDGDLASVDASNGNAAPVQEPVTTPAAAAPTVSAATAPLARRKPMATLTDEPVARPSGRSASTRRSPEEVRAMLSRYRRGIQDGRGSAPGTED